MITPAIDPMVEPLTKAQARAFDLFRQKLEQRVPTCRVAAVGSYNENIIEVWLDDTGLKFPMVKAAAKLAVEVEDKTGVCIVLR